MRAPGDVRAVGDASSQLAATPPAVAAQVITNKWVPGGETYVLYQCGTPRPSNVPAGAKVFEMPLVSVSSDDTTAADFMVSSSGWPRR